jgi:NADP-dependent 3-hydroxy acid dehydrogenase YdfG
MPTYDNRRDFGMQHKEPLVKHSVALVAGTTSGLGYASASMLAAERCRQVIVTGRSLSRVQETAAQLAAETKRQVFTPLELDLNAPASVHPIQRGAGRQSR